MKPMETAPADRSIRLRMPDGASFAAHLIPVQDEEGTCWTWAVANESDAPDDWCEGVCWASNSHGKPSARPIGWDEIVENSGAEA